MQILRKLFFLIAITGTSLGYLQAHAQPQNNPTVGVYMDQVAVGHSSQSIEFQVQGVATCLALSIYDEASGWVYLAHISAGQDTDVLVRKVMDFYKQKNIDSKKLVAHIAGGWVGWTESYLDSLLLSLDKNNINVQSVADFANTGFSVRDLDLPDETKVKGQPIRDFKFDFETGSLIELKRN